jgi:threonine/homoserine/homoserine lactone efflux protein
MKAIPNPVSFIAWIGVVITVTNVLTAPGSRRVQVLVAGVITTVLICLVVAIAVRWRARRQPPRSS